jgi:calpain-15
LPWRDKKATIVKVRNPWGNKEWKGDWSFGSNNWTPELKKRLNYEKNPHDGSFYMSL